MAGETISFRLELEDEPMPTPEDDAAFEDFAQAMHEKYGEAFQAGLALVPVANALFEKPVSEPLAKVLRFLAKMVVNSNGAVLLLSVYGYGNDAMKVVRSMYEAAVTAAYLRVHPEKVDDYLDYFAIRRWRFYEHMKDEDPAQVEHFTPEHVGEMKAEYEQARPKFVKNKKGDLYSSWRKGVSLKRMADETQLGDLYPVFYSVASSIQHVDVAGMSHQVADGVLDVVVAPNEKFVKEAAIVGQHMTLRVLYEFNAAAKLGFDAQIEEAGKNHVAAWKG
jgi:uncharacterized protein DUF5677